jgi:YbbR domain-containing protein
MRQFLRTLLFGDWLLKFFSLALAVLAWLAVSFSQRQKPVDILSNPGQQERSFFDEPVIVVSTETDVHEFKVKPSEVDITVQGARELIKDLTRKHVRVQVTLTGTNFTHGMRVPVEVVTPAGITHTATQPTEVEIIFPPALRPPTQGQ